MYYYIIIFIIFFFQSIAGRCYSMRQQQRQELFRYRLHRSLLAVYEADQSTCSGPTRNRLISRRLLTQIDCINAQYVLSE